MGRCGRYSRITVMKKRVDDRMNGVMLLVILIMRIVYGNVINDMNVTPVCV